MRPAEVSVSIRSGWYRHAADHANVRSVDHLFDLYASSIGQNGKLLLNVLPTREGVLHAMDVERLRGVRETVRARAATHSGGCYSDSFAHDAHPLRVTSEHVNANRWRTRR